MNQIILLGRLVRDVSISVGADSKTYARFRLAVNRNKQEADYFNCVCVDKNALNAEKYLNQGKRVLVTGSVRTGSYKNKDGVDIPQITVFVTKLDFIDYMSSDFSTDNTDSKNDDFSYIPDDYDLEGLPFN